MAVFPAEAELGALYDSQRLERWARLIALRERVVAEIEPLRQKKVIGSSLQAKVILSVPAAELAFLQAQALELPTLFIVSDVELRSSGSDERTVVIERAGGVKCERCWRYVPSVSTDPAWAGLCDRCQDALAAHV